MKEIVAEKQPLLLMEMEMVTNIFSSTSWQIFSSIWTVANSFVFGKALLQFPSVMEAPPTLQLLLNQNLPILLVALAQTEGVY